MATIDQIASNDTWIDGNSPTQNRNFYGSLVVGDVGGSDKGRVLLRFTLPADPGSGSTIDKIELKLWFESANGASSITHNVYGENTTDSTSWVDTQATWNNAATGNAWTAAGGASDFSSTIIDSLALTNSGTGAYVTWVIQGTGATNPLSLTWGDTINLMVRAPSSAGNNRFFSDIETAGTGQDPKLTITYTAGAGGYAYSQSIII